MNAFNVNATMRTVATAPPQQTDQGTTGTPAPNSVVGPVATDIDQSETIATSTVANSSDRNLDEKKLASAVAQLNDTLQKDGRNLQFNIDKETGVTVVQIRDQTTNEVIRQIPSEETLKLAKNLGTQDGLLFTAKA